MAEVDEVVTDIPVDTPENPALPVDSPEPGAGSEVAEQPVETPTEQPDWAIKRISKITAQKHEAERQAEATRQELAALKAAYETQGFTPQAETPATLTPAEVERRANEIAAQRLHEQTFNQRCNNVAEAGKKEFTDFQKSVDTLVSAGVMNNGFLEVATQLPDSHKVLQYLGKNPEKAMAIAEMPPVTMALELAKLAGEAGKLTSRPVSNAPAPIDPIDGKGGGPSGEPDPTNLEAWLAWREKEVAKGRRR